MALIRNQAKTRGRFFHAFKLKSENKKPLEQKHGMNLKLRGKKQREEQVL